MDTRVVFICKYSCGEHRFQIKMFYDMNETTHQRGFRPATLLGHKGTIRKQAKNGEIYRFWVNE